MMMLVVIMAALWSRSKQTACGAFWTTWKNNGIHLNHRGPLEYNFLDDQFAKLYAGELRTRQIFSAFAVIAIIIACMGLFGLSAFIIEQRNQRDRHPQSAWCFRVRQVLLLVSAEFLSLIVIAFIISIPVTWWAMSKWLQDYAYRINISVWVFAIAGIIAFLLQSLP